MAASAVALLCACGGGGSTAPKNWRPVAGEAHTWTNGSGSRYVFDITPFAGSLSDLASRVTIDVLTKNRGAKWQGNDPFPPCPGAAGIATFRLTTGETLAEGFAVSTGHALRAHYLRPARARVDPDAMQAMQDLLCKPPA